MTETPTEQPTLSAVPNIPEGVTSPAPSPVQEAPAPQAPAPQEEEAKPKRAEESPTAESDALLPDPGSPFTLSDGTEVLIRQLNLREFLAMMRIITRGSAIAFNSLNIDPSSETFATDIAALFVFSVAESEHETSVFLRAMVDPIENTEENNRNLDMLLVNPPIEDVIDIINYTVAKAAPNIKSLGKRLGTLWQLATRLGAL